MNNQQLYDDNCIIAEYAGAIRIGEYNNKEHGTTTIYNYKKGSIVPRNYYEVHSTGSMEYCSSYDWLMPIVIKLVEEDSKHKWILEHCLDITVLYSMIIKILKNGYSEKR